LIKLEGKTILFDMKDLSIIREFPNTFFSTVFNFSQTAHYLTVGSLVYNIVNDVEYNVITERNDFNRDETKIIGIANRYYD
ncbi:MAG: hypothetical protein R6U84_04115, partial [Candidatus Cloacimonadales bacterium]